ncbi:hypothetical protein BGX24_012496 [Mortierella sp. AD032]|nr:hypothetical protein BGX24_012496 [Mortierella sp. AD032]
MARNEPEVGQLLSDCPVRVNPFSCSCWNTSLLNDLFIHTDYNFLRIHPDLLSQCPRLTSICLEDPRKEYSRIDIVPWKSAELQHLKSLTLRGTPASSFHPDTLKTTPNLEDLAIQAPLSHERFMYISPEANLEGIEDAFAGLLSTDAMSTPVQGAPRHPKSGGFSCGYQINIP